MGVFIGINKKFNVFFKTSLYALLVLNSLNLCDASELGPSSESLRRYIAYYEQQRQLEKINALRERQEQVRTVGGPIAEDSGKTRESKLRSPYYKEEYEDWVQSPYEPQPQSLPWIQKGQPEVAVGESSRFDEKDLLDQMVQIYPPREVTESNRKTDSTQPDPDSLTLPLSKEPLGRNTRISSLAQGDDPRALGQISKHYNLETKDNNYLGDIYFVVIVAGCSAVAIFGVIAAGFCFYRFQKNNKAAAEVDYPAYGVTGPNKDSVSSPSGDRRLAQSAQMYHYQHQKQQMIAVEKAVRNTSASDVDSEEENEEGDYTVYECPGLAPPGEMEVKNPLFHDDSTPMSPPVDLNDSVNKT